MLNEIVSFLLYRCETFEWLQEYFTVPVLLPRFCHQLDMRVFFGGNEE